MYRLVRSAVGDGKPKNPLQGHDCFIPCLVGRFALANARRMVGYNIGIIGPLVALAIGRE